MNIKMKKQINSASSWSVKSIIALVILSAMFGVNNAEANNKPTVAVNTVSTENAENRNESSLNAETEIIFEAAIEYNAKEYVESELAREIDCKVHSNADNKNGTAGTKALQSEVYNAAAFVNSDMENEIENHTDNSCF